MCIENRKEVTRGRVVAWKIFNRRNKKLYGLRNFSYKIGKLHTTSHYAGFQAFVNRADAEEAIESAWAGFVVRKVYLYQATQGIITRMDHYSNGRPGWAAKKIRIPRLRK